MIDVQHQANLMAARERAIAALDKNPDFQALRDAFEDSKAETIQMVGERIVKTGKADTEKALITHGHIKGAHFWLNTRVKGAVETVRAAEANGS